MRHLDYALLLIIAWGLLAAGAVEPWAYRPLALAAAFIGGAALLASRGANKPGWALLAGFGLLAGAVLVQLVPIRWPFRSACVTPAPRVGAAPRDLHLPPFQSLDQQPRETEHDRADLMVASSACCHTDERQSRIQEWRASREGRRREAG